MFRPVKVRQYLALMGANGYPAEAVLAGSGITRELLDDPAYLMDLRQYKIVAGNILDLTGDQGIGLEFGAKTELMDLGMLGSLVMSAQTTRQTAQYWIDYSHELLGIPLHIALQERPSGEWALELSERIPLGNIQRFCLEEQLMMIRNLAGKLTSVESSIKLVELSYPAPPYRKLYEAYFKVPVEFNAKKTRITISSPKLDHPLLGNDKEFHEICSRQCELTAQKIHSGASIASKTKHVLMLFSGRNPGIEVVAAKLNMSARTLSRHLAAENYSYQHLMDEFRIELAQEYLASRAMSPKEIGYLLGFKHVASFHRAFKRWTGASITDYLASGKDKEAKARRSPHAS